MIPESSQAIQTASSTSNVVSAEMMVHLYCINRNLSKAAEKELFELIACNKFTKFDTTYTDFKKQQNLILINYKIYHCSMKPKKHQNTKPHRASECTITLPIAVYSVAEHLRLYFATQSLASGLITQSTFKGTYSDFTSGDYFKALCQSLPSETLPLCCTSKSA